MKIPGISLDGLDDRVDEFVALCLRATQRVANQTAKSLPGTSAAHVSLDDLNVLPVLWGAELDKTILPAALGFFLSASDRQADLIRRAQKEAAGLVAAVIAPEPGDFADYTIASESDAAMSYLAGARNRLVGIGDETWSAARTELVSGMQAGESVPKLAKRVSGAAGVGSKRATMIARTEVIGASNAGSIATMRQLGEVAKKEWLATGGPRTRPTHQSANGQIVNLEDPFIVGGASLDHPGDPSGPAREVINCRCTMTYDLAPDAAPAVQQPVQMPDTEPVSVVDQPMPLEFTPANMPLTEVKGDKSAMQSWTSKIDSSELDEKYATWDPTDDQHAALTAFRGSSAKINAALRRGEIPPDAKWIDQAIATAPKMERVADTYRTIDTATLKGIKVGDSFRDRGFLSISIDRDAVQTAAEGAEDQAIMRVRTLYHQQMARLSDDELLLPREAELVYLGKDTKSGEFLFRARPGTGILPELGAAPLSSADLLAGVDWGDTAAITEAKVAKDTAALAVKSAETKAIEAEQAAKNADILARAVIPQGPKLTPKQVREANQRAVAARLARQEAAKARYAATLAADEQLAAAARELDAMRAEITEAETTLFRAQDRFESGTVSGDEWAQLRTKITEGKQAVADMNRRLNTAKQNLDTAIARRQGHIRGMASGVARDPAWASANMPVPSVSIRQPVERYTGAAFDDWNHALRRAVRLDTNVADDPQWGVLTEKLDNVLEQTPLPSDTILHRGTHMDEFVYPTGAEPRAAQTAMNIEDIQSLVGSVQIQSGYLSTSLKKPSGLFSIAPAQIEFMAPAGTPATWVEPYSRVAGENEILLARGLRYYIHDVQWVPNETIPTGGLWKIYAEILPD